MVQVIFQLQYLLNLLLWLSLERVSASLTSAKSASYDQKALLLDGQRQLLFAGHIHYPRSTPDMWSDLFAKSKANGLQVIDTYVFWDEHEKIRGVYDFEGNRDLKKFIRLAGDHGLYVNLRIGPYVCAEWNFGGFPEWLKDIPGIRFRTYNSQFMHEMARFVTDIVQMVQDQLYENGGSIILLQIENEYGNVQYGYGNDGQRYIDWAVSFAQNLTSKAQWLVCQQGNQPSVIDACNGFYCDDWMDKRPAAVKNQPGFWIENWTGWFQNWGESRPTRPTEDLAFAVARFIARGGTYVGYYMFHGGTNFARSSGGPYIITSYDYNAPLDEFGFKNEPKYSHLQALHQIINQFNQIILYYNSTKVIIDPKSEIFYYGDFSTVDSIGFFCNMNPKADINYRTPLGFDITLPKWSVTLVQGGPTPKILYSSAEIESKETSLTYTPIAKLDLQTGKMIPEVIGIWNKQTGISHTGPLEQLSITHDNTDYFTYSTSIKVNPLDEHLHIEISQVDDAVSLWVDDIHAGFIPGGGSVSFSVTNPIQSDKWKTPNIQLTIVTQTVGLQNYGAHFDEIVRGITGSVMVNGENVSNSNWTHQVGLEGEFKGYYHVNSSAFTKATLVSNPNDIMGWAWYKISLPSIPTAPSSRYALDLSGLGRGNVFFNSHHLGRYWNITGSAYSLKSHVNGSAATADTIDKHQAEGHSFDSKCNYAGQYSIEKCRVDGGNPSQRYYHVPVAWIHDKKDNEIIIFEEMGGDLSSVSLVEVNRI